MRACLSLTAACILALLCACSAGDGRIPVFPVEGKVLYQEQPAEGALVIFNPVDVAGKGAIFPSATVQADGSFQLTSYETADGAPAGQYRVTLRWPEPPENPLEPPDMGPDRLGNRYIDPQGSPWQVEVVEGENRFEPFHVE